MVSVLHSVFTVAVSTMGVNHACKGGGGAGGAGSFEPPERGGGGLRPK